jgi:hypothetical protein
MIYNRSRLEDGYRMLDDPPELPSKGSLRYLPGEKGTANRNLFGPSFSVTFPEVLPISYIGPFRGIPPASGRQARTMKTGFRGSKDQGSK